MLIYNVALCFHQLKSSENCDDDDEDDVEVPQRILELSHVGGLHASHLFIGLMGRGYDSIFWYLRVDTAGHLILLKS